MPLISTQDYLKPRSFELLHDWLQRLTPGKTSEVWILLDF
jgi:hypothetical protein